MCVSDSQDLFVKEAVERFSEKRVVKRREDKGSLLTQSLNLPPHVWLNGNPYSAWTNVIDKKICLCGDSLASV